MWQRQRDVLGVMSKREVGDTARAVAASAAAAMPCGAPVIGVRGS